MNKYEKYERKIRRSEDEKDWEASHLYEDQMMQTFINDVASGKLKQPKLVAKQIKKILNKSRGPRWYA